MEDYLSQFHTDAEIAGNPEAPRAEAGIAHRPHCQGAENPSRRLMILNRRLMSEHFTVGRIPERQVEEGAALKYCPAGG